LKIEVHEEYCQDLFPASDSYSGVINAKGGSLGKQRTRKNRSCPGIRGISEINPAIDITILHFFPAEEDSCFAADKIACERYT
jgi:hypothetical protein